MAVKSGEYAVPGFRASAVASGLKKGGGLDLALLFSEREATAAGVFTTNKVKAAPVLVSQENIRAGKSRAIIANSGNANACTGKEGLSNARRTADLAAGALGIQSREVLVASTGVIGAPLNMDLMARAIPDLAKGLSPEGLSLFSKAIMTTDSFPKVSRFEGKAGGKPYRILGIAKGAGMIMPDMATMLCFVLSDIEMEGVDLRRALSFSVRDTFNRISVDGDTSTNDTVLVLANGMAGNNPLSRADHEGFQQGLRRVMNELAKMIVSDGEGATKVIFLRVRGAASDQDALMAARTVANSTLVKTAFFGQDPNWGRIMAALGRSGIQMREEDVSIWVDDIKIVENGLGNGTDLEKEAAQRMSNKEFTVTIDLHQGKCEEQVITCDLTHDYITINAGYRT